MSQQETNEFIVSMMKAGKVTVNESSTFMALSLSVMEQSKPGTAEAFMKEMIKLRGTRRFPDMSGLIR